MYIDIKDHIFDLENKLLMPSTRSSSEEIKKILSNDFVEFCSSGKIYNYSEGDTFYEAEVKFEITDFDLIELSKECVLATYKLNKCDKDNISTKSIRSSIWRYSNECWKMIFHQGTLIN